VWAIKKGKDCDFLSFQQDLKELRRREKSLFAKVGKASKTTQPDRDPQFNQCIQTRIFDQFDPSNHKVENIYRYGNNNYLGREELTGDDAYQARENQCIRNVYLHKSKKHVLQEGANVVAIQDKRYKGNDRFLLIDLNTNDELGTEEYKLSKVPLYAPGITDVKLLKYKVCCHDCRKARVVFFFEQRNCMYDPKERP